MLDWIKLLWQTESKDAEAKMIAKHLSKILLNGWTGVDALYPDLKDKANRLKKIMEDSGDEIKITETFRTSKRQEELYAQGRTESGIIVTNAKPLETYHSYGLAFDFYFTKYGYKPPVNILQKIANEAQKLLLIWGGSWNDSFHLEWHPTFKWQDLKPYFEVDK